MDQKYITVKDFYNILNKDHPGLIGINKLYRLTKIKGFPSCHLAGRCVIMYPQAIEWMIVNSNGKKKIRV